MKYPVGTVVIPLAGEVANSRDDKPVAIPPHTPGVVVDMLEDHEGNHVFVLFGPQDATTLLDESSLSNTQNYLVITPEKAARMWHSLREARTKLNALVDEIQYA